MEAIKEGYIRISELLSIYQAYAFVPKEKLKKAQEIGTDIHTAIESYFKGDFSPLDSKKNPYFQSFLQFATSNNIDPVLMEERMYSETLKITGRLDLLANVDGTLMIIDWKTGSWAHPEIWQLQGTFYRMLLQENGKPVPDCFTFVKLNREGHSPDLYTFQYTEKCEKICRQTLEIYDYFLPRLT